MEDERVVWSFVDCKEGRLKSVQQQTKHAENGDSCVEGDTAQHVAQQMNGLECSGAYASHARRGIQEGVQDYGYIASSMCFQYYPRKTEQI